MPRDLTKAAELRDLLAASKMPVSYVQRTLEVMHPTEKRFVVFKLEAMNYCSGRKNYPARRIVAEGIVVAAEAFVGTGWRTLTNEIGLPIEDAPPA